MVDITEQGIADYHVRRHWKAPVALRKELRPEEYPVDDLPPIIAEAVKEVQAYIQAPMALVAASALSVVSAAVQARFDIRRDAALIGPSSLYFLTIAESGERKSAIDRMFMAPVRDWEARQVRAAQEAKARYETAIEDWERDGKDLAVQLEQGMFRDLLGSTKDPRVMHELRKPPEPRVARMLRGDDTPEALQIALQAYPVAAIISAEAGLIFGSHGMGGDSVMRSLATFNVMWDGGPISQDRVGRERIYVERVRATLGLQVQSSTLQHFTHKSGNLAKGIGYFARFLFSQPTSTQGSRFYELPPADMPALRAFHSRVTALLEQPAEFDEFDRLMLRPVDLDAQAHDCWAAFHNEVEEQLGGDDYFSGIKEVASKAAENAARLACCYHAFTTDCSTYIARNTMDHACAVMRWYLDEAVRFGQVSGLTDEVRNAELIEAFLVDQTKVVLRGKLDATKVTVNRVRQHGPGSLRGKAKDIDAALEVLVDHGRIRIFAEPGSKSRQVLVNPAVMQEYI